MPAVDIKAEMGLFDEEEVSQFTGKGKPALRNDRCRGRGPPFIKLGNKVYYPRDQLRAYLKAHTVIPTRPKTLVDGIAKPSQ